MKKTTDELFKTLNKDNNLNHYFNENSEDFIKLSLSEYLNKLLLEKKHK